MWFIFYYSRFVVDSQKIDKWNTLSGMHRISIFRILRIVSLLKDKEIYYCQYWKRVLVLVDFQNKDVRAKNNGLNFIFLSFPIFYFGTWN